MLACWPEHVNPNGLTVRTAGTQDEPLFCLADVCKVLEISNPSDWAKALDDDEKVMLNTLDQFEGIRGNPNKQFVTEPGLYKVIMRSDKANAKAFQRWVCHDVLRREVKGVLAGWLAAPLLFLAFF